MRTCSVTSVVRIETFTNIGFIVTIVYPKKLEVGAKKKWNIMSPIVGLYALESCLHLVKDGVTGELVS